MNTLVTAALVGFRGVPSKLGVDSSAPIACPRSKKYHQIVGTSMNSAGNRWKQDIKKNRYNLIVYGRFWTLSDQEMAEEVSHDKYS